MKVIGRSVLVMAVLLLAACGGKDEKDAYVERPARDLYDTAEQLYQNRDYVASAKAFDEVERQHPYSELAPEAQLMAAKAQYEALNYDDAILALDRFLQLHPGHPKADYALYLKALCSYEQIQDIGRDQQMTADALDALTEVIRRYPDSEYARDARLKIDLARDHLAGKEMEIGRFYQTKNQYQAAINRYRAVIKEFGTTSHTAEALHRLVECYLSLGLADEARQAAAVLGHNYPGSSWYEDSYALLGDKGYTPSGRVEKGWLDLF